jgi:hypothetical protein
MPPGSIRSNGGSPSTRNARFGAADSAKCGNWWSASNSSSRTTTKTAHPFHWTANARQYSREGRSLNETNLWDSTLGRTERTNSPRASVGGQSCEFGRHHDNAPVRLCGSICCRRDSSGTVACGREKTPRENAP